MPDDIAPELFAKIQAQFVQSVRADQRITAIYAKLQAGTATHEDTHWFSVFLGDHAADALSANLTSGALPDGRLWYNIAQRTVRPILEENHGLVNAVAERVQARMNSAAGVGIKPIAEPLNENRVAGIINRLADADQLDDVAWMLDEPIKIFTQNVADDFMQRNMDFQTAAGLSPTVTRTVVGGCCAWCQKLAGTYEKDDAPADIYKRHGSCRCSITTDPKGRKK